MQNKNNNKNGYTIIETMIAISLFLVVIMIGMGALLNANLVHRKSQDMRSIMDNLSFIMEDMSKNLRTGYNYHCSDNLSNFSTPLSCTSGGTVIAFEPTDGNPANDIDQWIYYFGGDGKIYKSTDGLTSSPIQLTPDEVVIDSVSIFLVSSIASGMMFEKGIETLLLTGLGLTIASLIAKPVINILMLPINLITFGLFRWVAAVAVLYIVTLIVPGFKIIGFSFGGYSNIWFDVPTIALTGILAFLAFSLLHSLISSFIYWLIK